MSVSVIIPTFNAADYLREAIVSVLAQTYRPSEIIVVDDGSTDHTREVCASFGSNLRYFYQANDGTGGGGAQARGIRESSGELIAFLDHDDRWLPTKIEKQVKTLELYPDAYLTVCPSITIDELGQAIGLRDLYLGDLLSGDVTYLSSEDAFHLMMRGAWYCPSTGLVRRSFYERHGFIDLETVGTGDWESWLEIARNYSVLVINEALTEYRVSSGHYVGDKLRLAYAMQRTLKKQKGRFHRNCADCRESFRVGQKRIDEVFSVGARTCLDQYHRAMLEGNRSEALRHVGEALLASPGEVLAPRRLAAIVKNCGISTLRWMTNHGKTV